MKKNFSIYRDPVSWKTSSLSGLRSCWLRIFSAFGIGFLCIWSMAGCNIQIPSVSDRDPSSLPSSPWSRISQAYEETTHPRLNLPIEVSGWYNDGWDNESHAVYLKHHHVFSELNPFWYHLGKPTNPGALDGSITERTYAYHAQKVKDIQARGDIVLPAIADNVANQMDKIMADTVARQKLIENIVNTVVSRGYDGINLNFERMSAQARDRFTVWVDALGHALHAKGKGLCVAIIAARNTREEGWHAFDYAKLAKTSIDRFKIMMYDHNFYDGTQPNPIGPVSWIREVLDHAIQQGIPRSKIHMSIHNYGWTWKKRTNQTWQILFPHSTFAQWLAQHGSASLLWDDTAKEHWGDYQHNGESYRTWVGTSRSALERLAIAQQYGLQGISFWVLGREDSSIYSDMCQSYGSQCTIPPDIPPTPQAQNLALRKTVTASSQFNEYYTAALAVDGNLVEGWLANPAEAQSWILVDLGKASRFHEIQFHWGGYDYAKKYVIQTSLDKKTWTNLYTQNLGQGGHEIVKFQETSARYIRVQLKKKGDNWSYEIYELSVFGYP